MPPTPEHALRSFVAVDLDEPVLASVCELQRELARLSADVRWVRPEGMHVTLKFLGNVPRERIEEIHATLEVVGAERAPFSVHVRGLGAFPSLRRPRVIWAGLDSEELTALAGEVEAALAALGFAAERRGFTPHVTLGRVNSLRDWAPTQDHLEMHRDDEFGSAAIAAVTLYRSELRPGGSLYTPIWTIGLNSHKKGT